MMGTYLWIGLVVAMVFWLVLILIINLLRMRNMQALRKEAQRILDSSEKNFQYWMGKLENEQRKMQDSMDVLNREYYEHVLEKRKDEIKKTEVIEPEVRKVTKKKKGAS